MTSLELYAAALDIISELESPEGADPDAIAPRLAAWIDAADDKVGALYAVLRRIDAEDTALKAEQEAFAAARKRLATQEKRVRELAIALLSARDQVGEGGKVTRPTFSAWLTTSEVVVVPPDVQELPNAFVTSKTTYTADKLAIKAAIKAGDEVKGCAIVESRSVTFRAAKVAT